MAQRVGRGIPLLFHYRGTRRGVSGQQHAPAALYPWERPGTHRTGGWVGPRAGLEGRKISPPPGFDPGPLNAYTLSEIITSCKALKSQVHFLDCCQFIQGVLISKQTGFRPGCYRQAHRHSAAGAGALAVNRVQAVRERLFKLDTL